MAALRLILLVAGLLFIGLLVAWESRRGRSRGDDAGRDYEPRPDARDIPTLHLPPLDARSRGARAEPPLGDTDAVAEDDIAGEAPVGLMPAPGADTMADLHAAGGLRAVDAPLDAADFLAAADLRVDDLLQEQDADSHPAWEPEPPVARAAPQQAIESPLARDMARGHDEVVDGVVWHAQPGEGVEISDAKVRESAPLPPLELPPSPPLIVEWPSETERHIVGIRLVARSAERFAGRALRQALAAAGFVHGRFGIYHLPAQDGRAVVSAASLSRPGILDPDNMDFQRFTGLNLFIVLPGALTPEASFECLVEVGAELAERLGGQLQDERGARLDATRAAALREELLRMMVPAAAPSDDSHDMNGDRAGDRAPATPSHAAATDAVDREPQA